MARKTMSIGDSSFESDDEHDDEFVDNKINPNKWCGLFRGYIRKDYCKDELRASWVELFNDLIFVACIVHLAYEAVHSLPTTAPHTSTEDTNDTIRRRLSTESSYNSNCGEYDFVLTVFAQFGLFSTFWLEQVMYITHFICNQIGDEIVRVLYMTMVLSMGIFIGNQPSYHMAFLISYAILRFFSLFMYFKVLLIPRAKWHALWHICLYLGVLIIILYIIFCMDTSVLYGECPMIYFGIYCTLFIVEYIGRTARLLFEGKNDRFMISMNMPHIAERYGLLVMIILGESLISLMTANIGQLDLHINTIKISHLWTTHTSTGADIMEIICILLTFILSYFIGRLYYECQPTEERILANAQNHALGRSNKIYAKLYQSAHQVLFFGLFGYGVGVSLVNI